MGTIRVDDVGVLSPLLRAWFLGVIEGVSRRSVSPDAVAVEITRPDAASVFEIDVVLDTNPFRRQMPVAPSSDPRASR
jgi:hypothetical protein